MAREIAGIGINDIAGIRRAPITATAVGDVAAHESANDEIDEREEDCRNGGVGGGRVLCQEEVEVIVQVSRQMFEERVCDAVKILLQIGGPSLKA